MERVSEVGSQKKKAVLIFGLNTKLIEPKDSIVEIILNAVSEQGLTIDEKDVFVIASKAVATAQGRIVKLSSVKPSRRARNLANKYDLEPNLVEIILKEAEEIYGGVPGVLLTLKHRVIIPNAGVDRKNAPEGYVTLWPKNPNETSEEIRRELSRRTGKNVGVLIIDSRITPLRMGTTGVAIGIAGFEPIRDCRINRDIYGNPLFITRHALADDLSSAAHLIMGEIDEKIPVVLIKNAPLEFDEKIDPDSTIISTEQCLFMNGFENIDRHKRFI